ncbi:hypothetical protein J7M28_03385 [bacterium]|nr:hypothetical protein [bacterium]
MAIPKSRFVTLICCLVLLIACFARADISARASVDKKSVKLGEQFDLTLQIVHDKGYKAHPPSAGETLGDFHVVKSTRKEATLPDGRETITYEYTLAGFRLHRATIASIEVPFEDPTGRSGLLETEPLGITMAGTAPEEATDIKDIRDLVPIEARMALWLKILIGLAAVLVAFFIARFLMAKRKPAEEPLETIELPASEVALAAIKRLVESDLLFEGKHKEFYFALSEIMRKFITRRLKFPADDMTMTEIEYQMRGNPISGDFARTTLEVLRFSDLAKFAKLIPSDDETDKIIEKSRNAIELGREPLFDNDTATVPDDSASDGSSAGGTEIVD